MCVKVDVKGVRVSLPARHSTSKSLCAGVSSRRGTSAAPTPSALRTHPPARVAAGKKTRVCSLNKTAGTDLHNTEQILKGQCPRTPDHTLHVAIRGGYWSGFVDHVTTVYPPPHYWSGCVEYVTTLLVL
jgi:hypothetical protein